MRMSRRIAVVEDEAPIRENYLDAFRRHGFDARGYPDRASAERDFAGGLPDLVIIDIGLGDEPEGGFELCRTLRARSQRLPIIFLTARDSELDAVSGLRLGADDYLTKDISIPHLMARVNALLRRLDALARPGPANGGMARGPLEIDSDCLSARWRGRPVDLTVTEFWIVHALARYPGHVRTREQLMAAASLVVDESTVTSHIKRIRRKFQHHDPEFDRLSTVHGAGYRWVAPE
jgi:two-component system, OmpR family, response regulator